jgi:hypothetical protein
VLKLWVGGCGVDLQIRKKKGAKIRRIELVWDWERTWT